MFLEDQTVSYVHRYQVDTYMFQCMICHLGRVTRLVARQGEEMRDVIVRPFLDNWPLNGARW